MTGAKIENKKKNAVYCPASEWARPVEGARVFAWQDEVPWFCTPKKHLVATVGSGMELSFGPDGAYRLSYVQHLDPKLKRMRWTYRMIALDKGGERILDFLVDTREHTVQRGAKSWIYQIHTGSEVIIARRFQDIAAWDRDLSGRGWFWD